jgi:hypothetical protein
MRGNLLASVRDNITQVVTSSAADIWYSIARHVIVIQVHQVIIFCSPLPLRIEGIIDIPLIAEAVVPLVRIRHARPYILGLCLGKGCANSETVDQFPLKTNRTLFARIRKPALRCFAL